MEVWCDSLTTATGGSPDGQVGGGGSGDALVPLQVGEQTLSYSQRRRRKRLENKRKRQLAEDEEVRGACEVAPEHEEGGDQSVACGLLPTGSSTKDLQGCLFNNVEHVLEAEHRGRLAAEAALRAARELIVRQTAEGARRVAPPPIVTPKPGGYHAVHLPSGVLVLAPDLIDAMAAFNILRVELMGARLPSDHVRRKRLQPSPCRVPRSPAASSRLRLL